MADGEDKQDVALLDLLAFAGVGFEHRGGLRGHQADDAAIGGQEARDARLARVLTGPQEGEDDDGDGQNETRRGP